MEKKWSQINPEDFVEIRQEVGKHTKECAYNSHFNMAHHTCRDCPCHHYTKW